MANSQQLNANSVAFRVILVFQSALTTTLPLEATDVFCGAYMASARTGGRMNSPAVTARRP